MTDQAQTIIRPSAVHTDKPTPPSDNKPKQAIAIIIDDEPANRDFLVRLVAQADFKSLGAKTGQEGLKLAAEQATPPSVIFIDRELPDGNGIDLVKQFRDLYPTTKLIIATMHDSPEIIKRAFKQGCNAFLVKPHGFMELFKRLKQMNDTDLIDQIIFDRHGVRDFRE